MIYNRNIICIIRIIQMRRDMIDRREGETTMKVKIHHDGMVKLNCKIESKIMF